MYLKGMKLSASCTRDTFFFIAQGIYADAASGDHFEVVEDHDVPADPRVVFAEAE